MLGGVGEKGKGGEGSVFWGEMRGDGALLLFFCGGGVWGFGRWVVSSTETCNFDVPQVGKWEGLWFGTPMLTDRAPDGFLALFPEK